METRLRHHRQQEEHLAGMSPENFAASPLSGDEAADVSTPSPPRKSRKGGEKRVVSVPTVGGGGSRSKTEVYPPPDSWSWRKYGQKPIKGSPYPRGYYRCSSSKGCPARKQVERSRLDPTTLLLTYTSTHNHPPPTKIHHHHSSDVATITAATTAASDPAPPPSPDLHIFADPDPEIDRFREIAGDLGWFPDAGSRFAEIPAAGSVLWRDADVALMLPVGEEDQSLFGDLGELPECSVAFRRGTFETPCFAAGTG